jgi:RNA polymerase sigma-70 factor (ECF subfamily)
MRPLAAAQPWLPTASAIIPSVEDRGHRGSGEDPTERRLAARLIARERGAVEEVYERYGRACFGFLLGALPDRGAAEDVQQQVFLEVWQRAPSYDPDRGGLLTWIMVIARSRAIDHLRRRVPEPTETAPETRINEAVDELAELAERWRIAGLLDRLHPEEAMVLRMRFYDELTQAEIADRTGLPLGTVKMRMVNALDRLRDLMEDDR